MQHDNDDPAPSHGYVQDANPFVWAIEWVTTEGTYYAVCGAIGLMLVALCVYWRVI